MTNVGNQLQVGDRVLAKYAPYSSNPSINYLYSGDVLEMDVANNRIKITWDDNSPATYTNILDVFYVDVTQAQQQMGKDVENRLYTIQDVIENFPIFTTAPNEVFAIVRNTNATQFILSADLPEADSVDPVNTVEVGDIVLAKWRPYVEDGLTGSANPFFEGTISSVDDASGILTIDYIDGSQNTISHEHVFRVQRAGYNIGTEGEGIRTDSVQEIVELHPAIVPVRRLTHREVDGSLKVIVETVNALNVVDGQCNLSIKALSTNTNFSTNCDVVINPTQNLNIYGSPGLTIGPNGKSLFNVFQTIKSESQLQDQLETKVEEYDAIISQFAGDRQAQGLAVMERVLTDLTENVVELEKSLTIESNEAQSKIDESKADIISNNQQIQNDLNSIQAVADKLWEVDDGAGGKRQWDEAIEGAKPANVEEGLGGLVSASQSKRAGLNSIYYKPGSESINYYQNMQTVVNGLTSSYAALATNQTNLFTNSAAAIELIDTSTGTLVDSAESLLDDEMSLIQDIEVENSLTAAENNNAAKAVKIKATRDKGVAMRAVLEDALVE